MNILIFWIIPSVVTLVLMLVSYYKIDHMTVREVIGRGRTTVILFSAIMYPLGWLWMSAAWLSEWTKVKVRLEYVFLKDAIYQMPEGYLVASRTDRRWQLEIDRSVNVRIYRKAVSYMHENGNYVSPEQLIGAMLK